MGLSIFEPRESSGAPSVRIILVSDEGRDEAERAISDLEQLGCTWEGADVLVSIDIPPEVDQREVMRRLQEVRYESGVSVDVGYLAKADNAYKFRKTSESFKSLVYAYVTSLVPSWRVCDEAWALGEEHLVGIGVQRNYGGELMIVPLADDDSLPHPSWPDIEASLKATGRTIDRVVVVLDDRNRDAYRAQTPFEEIPWSERERVKDYVAKDQP